MRVFIVGVDGYLGWALAQHLRNVGHHVAGMDALLRRNWVDEVKSISAIPIFSREDRIAAFEEHYDFQLEFHKVNLLQYEQVKEILYKYQPDAIVHLGEMPSAAYSMIDQEHSLFTQQNNVLGNLNLLWAIKEACPQAHLVKLGTMGEYGTPNIDIPEGFFEVEYRGRKDILPFPKQAASFYHWSKVHDSNNTMYACKIWGLRSTDIMQGVVFGTQINNMSDDPRLKTRLDFDQCFGTVINRFCCQAVIGHPLTVFGKGMQRRGFLPLRDSMQCLTIAIENPPSQGEYRVFNQFENTYSIRELADIVKSVAQDMELDVPILHYDNPRIEDAEHYFNPDRNHLVNLGYTPGGEITQEIRTMLEDLLPHRQRIMEKMNILIPDIRWSGDHKRSQLLEND